MPEPQLDLMLGRFNCITPVADVTANLKVMVMKGDRHRKDAILHLDTVVSPDGPRLACCRIGLAQHHPDSQVYKQHFFSTCSNLPVLTAPWPSQAIATTGPEFMYDTFEQKSTGFALFFTSISILQVLGRMAWLPDRRSAPLDEPLQASSSWGGKVTVFKTLLEKG